MTIIPVRGVGELGVVSDYLPYDVPINAWADARNVRFKNRTVGVSSAFKKTKFSLTLGSQPMALLDATPPDGVRAVVCAQKSGALFQIRDSVQTDVSPTTPWIAATSRVTSTFLGSVIYLNNNENRPLYRAHPSIGAFSYVPGWASTDRAKTIRAYKDYLVALDITKGTTLYPAMVKWSNAVQAGAPPSDWDVTSPSSHAGETVLNDATGKLIDGLALGSSFILYGSNETYRMTFIGTPFIFEFEKLYDDLGVFAQDCVVEIEGKHYVFGKDGIYIHDGMSKVSISDQKVTNKIYSRIDFTRSDRCFVFHNPVHKEIVFAYPSISSDAKWNINQVEGCNEAAVFNYSDGTWSFIDLPGATCSVLMSLTSLVSWNDLATWNSISATWRSYTGADPYLPLLGVAGNPSLSVGPSLVFYDNEADGFLLNDIWTAFRFSGFVTTSIKDSDEFGASLSTTKLIRTIHTQATAQSMDSVINVYLGSARNPYTPVNWKGPMVFQPSTDYKTDFNKTGRYLVIKYEFPVGSSAIISGYDIDLEILAQR